MFGLHFDTGVDNNKAILNALDRSLAIIEFSPDGIVLSANENFCKALGYELSEIKGKHHRLFVEPEFAQSHDYQEFWSKLARGEFDAREYKRIGKGGREVWIQASYNPVANAKGVVVKVIKVATVITAEKLKNAEYEAKLNAISLVQATIEFTPEGEIITANDNFLNLMGYRLDELRGRHHRVCVDPLYAQSTEYEEFWRTLNRGEYVAASFKRFGKNGKEVWIQASYNPIFDLNRKVIKIVKYATDITDLTEIGSGLSRLAANDFTQPIERPFSVAFAKLRQDFNLAHDNLKKALMQAASGANVIQSGTSEISEASNDLARRTEQQAASLEETAAALNEITGTVRRSADSAVRARQVVAVAAGDSKKGAVIVKEAVAAMDAIARSSQQIGQIIGVIDEIAFQTNLLALNAGVEAARAGDSGRGFAVVAAEVRALAQRSAEAAKEIKGLILASTSQVDHGVRLVAETGSSLERIIAQVSEINNTVVEIASGANEQSVALQEVNTAITQMDQMTQQNAAMVEQSTAACQSLFHETQQLAHMIGKFQFEASKAASRRAKAERYGEKDQMEPPRLVASSHW